MWREKDRGEQKKIAQEMDICRLASDDHPDSMKMVEIDFQALCRICGALGENLTSVFGKRAADRLRERIEKHLLVQIRSDDCLPSKICDGCRETLDRFHELFEKCHRTEENFRSMLAAEAEGDAVPVPAANGEPLPDEALLHTSRPTTMVMDVSDAKQAPEEKPKEAEEVPRADETKSCEMIQKNAEEKQSNKRVSRSSRSSFTCSFCKTNGSIKMNTFADKEGLVDHLKDQHADQIFHCEQCDNYLDRNILIQHMTMHALSMFTGGDQSVTAAPGEEESPEPEDEDGQKPQTSGMDLEEGEGSQETVEGKSGDGTEAANRENGNKSPPSEAVEPKPGEGRKLYCYICEKTLANRSAYSYHINQVHLNIKNFSCTYCNKKFGNQRLLNNHVAGVHSRERNFTCDTCSKRFKTNVALYNHQRTHDDSAAAKFSCTFCDKKFRFRNHLTSHQLVHMNERNFPCNQCDKKFNNPECLQKHKLTHVETLPYQCPLCGFSTKQKRYLVMHAKRIHMVR
ncbi:zinc finger protein 84-like isoform X1 [Uranotaenia lowii]|uniref:zinc finger protein 84-like isoform X1 n=1 Tax=Uranotaenia lowii TaxID=190385 RepID=UPI002479EB4B|nr:zinc finger protein 84-like isoform X1 [Uranotaenia lowii]